MKLHFEPDLDYPMAAIEAVSETCFVARKYAVRLILKQLRPGDNPGKYVVARSLDDVLAHSCDVFLPEIFAQQRIEKS